MTPEHHSVSTHLSGIPIKYVGYLHRKTIGTPLKQETIAISGSWRNVPSMTHYDVIQYVRWLIVSGHTLVTGGALGVDEIAITEAIRLNARPDQIIVWLPTPLETYISHYRTRAEEGVITRQQASDLENLLRHVKAHHRLLFLDHQACNKETYYARNDKVLEAATHLAAFQVEGSEGVQDAIDKARLLDIPMTLKTYKRRPRSSTPVEIEE